MNFPPSNGINAKILDFLLFPVSVRFQPIGSAPILKQKVFKISASSRFSVVLNFLRKKVGVREGDGLFLYINSVFAPGLDEGVGNLFRVCLWILILNTDRRANRLILILSSHLVLQGRRSIDRELLYNACLWMNNSRYCTVVGIPDPKKTTMVRPPPHDDNYWKLYDSPD